MLRSTVSGTGHSTLATDIVSTQYTNTSCVVGTTYYYVVRAVNAGGTSADSLEASVTCP